MSLKHGDQKAITKSHSDQALATWSGGGELIGLALGIVLSVALVVGLTWWALGARLDLAVDRAGLRLALDIGDGGPGIGPDGIGQAIAPHAPVDGEGDSLLDQAQRVAAEEVKEAGQQGIGDVAGDAAHALDADLEPIGRSVHPAM